MNIRRLLCLLALCFPWAARAQGNCNNPITLSSVVVSNTQCGASTGTIIVTPAGTIGAYTFQWTPSVSITNVATGLVATTYNIHIERVGNPNCTLDTLVVVNNSNGPQVQANISPAQCLANNGSISLSPTNFLYNWNTGATGPNLSGLESKNYYVTVTNPNNGCYSIFKYFVPRDLNSLSVSAQVLANAKCGMNNGRAQISVTGGSGQYSYLPGPGPQYNNMPPGNYAVQVLDLVTGCTGSAGFSIQALPVSGTVTIAPQNARCAGQATGLLEFDVTPGANFALPYTFTLKNQSGISFSPGALPAGNYTLEVFDTDGCPLPPQNFSIAEPPAFVAQPQTLPETCTNGGSISLHISGGNGTPYIVNWADLPGDDNPKDRVNLPAGLYSALIYDSLFCAYPVDNLLVAPNCNNLEYVHFVVGANSSDMICMATPVGLAPGATSFSIIGSGGSSGNTAYGNWALSPGGCLSYAAGPATGFGLDTICIITTAAQIGLKDTTCVVVSIAEGLPSKQSVFFTVQVDASATACGTIPPGFSNYAIVQVGRPGLSGTSDAFGRYDIDTPNACLAFYANNFPGFNVDEIKVAVYDQTSKKCHIISYFPTILPQYDCTNALALPDTIQLITTDCNGLATTCVPIPFYDVVNYTIIDNAALYNAGYSGCNPGTVRSYNVVNLPPGAGPYELSEWVVNGQTLSGNFLNFNGLVALMNLLDPSGLSWSAQGPGLIRGGSLGSTYGPMTIRSAAGSTQVYNPATASVDLGTELRFDTGFHRVILRNVLTACSDTVAVNVLCFDCAPIHSYPLTSPGNIVWNTTRCDVDTVFCTNIPNADLGQYVITDNGLPFLDFSLCGNFVGLLLDTGVHHLVFSNPGTTCTWSLRFQLDCKTILNTDTLNVFVPLGGTSNICLDTAYFNTPVSSITNLCQDEGNDIIAFSYNLQQWCAIVFGQNPGTATLCLQLCSANGECANYIVNITVSNSPSDSLLAVPDAVFVLKDEETQFNIIANDIIGGIVGNLGGLQNVEFLTNPRLGFVSFSFATGEIIYTPIQGKCGVDSFHYRITDLNGRQSTATVTLTISCDKVLVFKGISPNGDGRNDTWSILGIEQYPDNTVQVFNRWGNLVFEQKGYRNEAPWNGQWNGKDLPDGTYFYLIELGGNAGSLSGWLQILR